MIEDPERLTRQLGCRFVDQSLLELALTHSSHGQRDNERLEFLGDSVLSLVVSFELYQRNPGLSEGELTRLRARLVRGETLAEIAASFDIGNYLRMGAGELRTGGFRRPAILADAVEALIGAIYLDQGLNAARSLVMRLLGERLAECDDPHLLKDPKTRLQEWLQARRHPLPSYELIDEWGADHKKSFKVSCSVGGLIDPAEATGSSRRRAEQEAARLVLERLVSPGH